MEAATAARAEDVQVEGSKVAALWEEYNALKAVMDSGDYDGLGWNAFLRAEGGLLALGQLSETYEELFPGG